MDGAFQPSAFVGDRQTRGGAAQVNGEVGARARGWTVDETIDLRMSMSKK